MTVTDKTTRFLSGSGRPVFLVVPRSAPFTYQGLIYIKYDCLTHINRSDNQIKTRPILVDFGTKERFHERSGNPIEESDAKKLVKRGYQNDSYNLTLLRLDPKVCSLLVGRRRKGQRV
jgi:hypothetical protein